MPESLTKLQSGSERFVANCWETVHLHIAKTHDLDQQNLRFASATYCSRSEIRPHDVTPNLQAMKSRSARERVRSSRRISSKLFCYCLLDIFKIAVGLTCLLTDRAGDVTFPAARSNPSVVPAIGSKISRNGETSRGQGERKEKPITTSSFRSGPGQIYGMDPPRLATPLS